MRHMTRRTLALLLTLAMLCGMLCTTAGAAGGTWSGSGTQADPYLIEDADDLEALSTNVNNGTSKYTSTYFKLTDDITVSEWNPIGPSSSKCFAGNFDGDGHTVTINGISSTYYTSTYSSYAGLFGYLYTGAVVHDVTVDGSISYAAGTTGTTYVGGIAGYAYGTVLVNCVNKAAVDTTSTASSAYLGGIVAYTSMNTTSVLNCYNEGTVSAGSVTNPRLGGIAGNANSGTFQYCYTATGYVYGNSYATVTDCYDATTWAALDEGAKSAWVEAANASVSSYTSVNDFWSMSSSGTPEHTTCQHQHAADDTGTVTAPSCTDKGYTTYTCTICGQQYKDNIQDALGHDFTDFVETVAPTCTEQGYDVYRCAHDNTTTTQINFVDATGHTWDGNGICTICGAKKLEVFDDFFYGMDSYLTAANDASYPWTVGSNTAGDPCLVSGNKGVSSKTSTLTLTALVDGTLTFDYWSEGEGAYDYLTIKKGADTIKSCKGSGTSAVVSSGSISQKLAAGEVVTIAYSKDSSGDKGEDCAKVWNIVFTPDHIHSSTSAAIRTVEPTCTERGYSVYMCDADNEEYQADYVPALGHDFSVYVETVEPTCTERGYDVYRCARDNTTTEQRNFVDANGHTWGDDDICDVCGAQKAWDGTTMTAPAQQDGVYLIGTGEELAWFANQVNSSADNTALNAKLTSDINLGDHEWTPIGNYRSTGTASYNRVYSGTFDGDGHMITGLNVTGSSSIKVTGLFGYVVGGTIKNLAVYGTVTGYTLTGGYSGGFIGQCFGVTMDNCANYATVSGYYSGGLIGTTSSTSSPNTRTTVSITNSYNAGSVSGNEAGGLLGELAGTLATDTIQNGFNCGAISATTNYLGTIYGYANTYTNQPVIDNFYYLNTQTYGSSYTVGTGKSAEEFTTLAASLGEAFVDSADLGHPILTWEAPEPEHVHDYADYRDNGDGTHTGTCAEDSETVTEPHVLNADGECVYCGYKQPGSKSNPIQISTADELKALADAVNSGDSKAGVYYELTADLTMDGTFAPIGTFLWGEDTPTDVGGTIIIDREPLENSFAGVFNGQGHTVTVNITDSTGSNARVGLFGSVVGGTVKNVIVAGSVQTINGGSCVAGVVGYAKNAVIENCGNAAVVLNKAGDAPSNGAAGVLGRSDGNVTLTGCFNVGKVTADGYAAGIVYDANGATTIINCYDVGTLTALSATGYTGGIVAVPMVGMAVTLTNCYADGTYNATKPGAVIGTISQAMTLTNVYSSSERWLGSESDYGFSGAPTVFTDYTTLLNGLGEGFKANDGSYPLLAWQTAAAVPSESTHVHTNTDTVTAPTCTEQGYTTHTCTDCGYSYVDTYVDALGHEYGPAVSNGDGTHTLTCVREGCDESTQDHTKTEDCVYDEGTVITPAGKDTAGEILYTCTICGYEKPETIPAIGFNVDENGNYLIETDADLARLAEKVNAGTDYSAVTFLLTADVSSTTPIGTIEHPFNGCFDGGYHTVTVTINDSTKDFNGLFGAISGAVVEKVLVAGTVTGGSFTAGVAGYATGSIIRACGNTAVITGGDNHTFGQNQGPNDCYAGGIVGYATGDTRIIACYNRGAVSNVATKTTAEPCGSKFTGGIVGDLYSGSVQYCYNTGAISISTAAGTSYTYTGGIAGMSWSNSILNSYNTGSISSGGATYTGGVVGSTNLYYQQGGYSYYLTGTAAAGAGTGSDSPTYILSASADDLKSADSEVAANLGSNFVADGNNANGGYLILAWEADPTAEIGYITEIYTAADLREFANNVRGGHSYEGETVKLMANIDLAGTYDSTDNTYSNIWTAIGNVNGSVFAGTFDGQGYTIANMVILNDQSGYLGLFSVLPEGAVVKNVTVTGIIDCAASSVGSIVGWNLGTVENCVSYVDINVRSCQYVGGIVADNAGTVTGCINNGTVNGNGTSSYVGGIAGHMEPAYDGTTYEAATEPVLTNCVNAGDVTGCQYVGGIVGGLFNDSNNYYVPNLTNCYNAGAVTGSYRDLSGNDIYTGVIAGKTVTGLVNCYYELDGYITELPPAGDISGEDYTRPVSADYAKLTAFADELGGFFQYDAASDSFILAEEG